MAVTTGTRVRALTSGMMISSANSTPPIGVLKVAAIPPPAPAAMSVVFLPGGQTQELSQGRTKRRTNLNDRPFAADGSAAPDRQRRRQRFDDRHYRANHSLAVVNSLDDFRHAVALRFRSEVLDQKDHSDAPTTGTRITNRPQGPAGVCMFASYAAENLPRKKRL